MISTIILSLLPLAASFPGGPPHGPPHGGGKPICPSNTCLSTSISDFAWDVSLEYHSSETFTTPAHQNSWGYINLNLTNPAVSKTTITCAASSNRLSSFFFGDQWFGCEVNDAAKAKGVGETSFRYSTRSRVDLNQTWGCEGVKFNALGTAGLENMKCTEESWSNPNWTMGSIYSSRNVKCEPVVLKIKPYEEKIVL